MESKFAFYHFELLLVNRGQHQFLEPLVDEVHPVIANITTDEKSKCFNVRYPIIHGSQNSFSVEAAVKFRVLFNCLADHQLILAISKLVLDHLIDLLELIPPLKVNYDISPAGAILLRNFFDRINKDSIVRIRLGEELKTGVF